MNKAYFFRKEKEIPLSHFVVEKVIELPIARYTMFTKQLLLGYDFIWENHDLMYVDSNNVWHCLLVKAEGSRDGILVNAEGSSYARYAAYCPRCSDVEEGGSRRSEMEGSRKMKTYLAKFSIRDGEHEYRAEFLVQATSYDEAFELARSQEHEPVILDEDDGELNCWDYGDGTTASRLEGVVAITEEEVRVLKRFGLAFNFN